MALLSQKEFYAAVKAGEINGCYLFFGDEEYVKHSAARQIREALLGKDALHSLGYEKISGEGKTSDQWLPALQMALDSLPLLGGAKLVELHTVNYSRLSEGELAQLEALLEGISAGTVLLLYALGEEFDAGVLPKRPSPLYKKLAAIPAVKPVLFERETPARLGAWVQKHFAANRISCSPAMARAMIDYCSPDMFTLAGEIEKLSAYLLWHGQTQVSEEALSRVCRSSKLDGAFSFTNAVLEGKTAEAMRLLCAMKRRKEPPERILAGIADTVGGMYNCSVLWNDGMQKGQIAAALGLHEYRVGLFLANGKGYSAGFLRTALRMCERADHCLKSAGGDRYLPLELLVLRLAGRSGERR